MAPVTVTLTLTVTFDDAGNLQEMAASSCLRFLLFDPCVV
jgi:hypothetical protein